jgi:hypothetical protein
MVYLASLNLTQKDRSFCNPCCAHNRASARPSPTSQSDVDFRAEALALGECVLPATRSRQPGT